jgi:hypothetical protein
MKRFIILLALLITLFALINTMSGCVKSPNNDYFPETGDTVKIIIGYENDYTEYTVDIIVNSEGEPEMLGKHLDRVIQDNTLNVVYWNQQTDDRFLAELGNLKPNMNNGEYIFIMANIDDPFWTGGMNMSVEYKGEVFYDTNYGFDKMPILEGVSYLFTVIKW